MKPKNKKRINSLIIDYSVVWTVCASLLLGSYVFAKDSIQPIKFNHDFHIEELGLSCLDCHKNAERHQRASIPNIDECSECHEDEFENFEADKVTEFINSDIQIPWVKVHKVADHAYFSHRRHVRLGNIECTECHGDVSSMSLPFQKAHVNMDMDWCLSCHEARHVTDDCAACHR
jgi:hypothetical protein